MAQHREYGQYFIETINGVWSLKIVNHYVIWNIYDIASQLYLNFKKKEKKRGMFFHYLLVHITSKEKTDVILIFVPL